MIFRFMVVNPREWCFAPTYVFRDTASGTNSFECILFPPMGTATPSDIGSAFRFGFASQQGKDSKEISMPRELL